MTNQVAILGEAGSIVLSQEVREAVGFASGECLEVVVEHGHIVLRALEENDLDRLAGSMPELRGAVEELIEERRRSTW